MIAPPLPLMVVLWCILVVLIAGLILFAIHHREVMAQGMHQSARQRDIERELVRIRMTIEHLPLAGADINQDLARIRQALESMQEHRDA